MQDVAEFKISEMLGIALTIVVTAIGISYGIHVVHDIQNTSDNNCDSGYWYNTTSDECCLGGNNCTTTGGYTYEYNSTRDSLTALAKMPSKFPLIMTIVVAAILIGILTRYLWVRSQA